MTLPRMDSRIGLDYIVENREYVLKLGAALDTQNTTVKKQVFELLSALCAYNSEGYSRAIETLEHYKNLKNERYRFKIVINELEKTTIVEYQVALLAFINCVIISASSLQDRLRIRNEFIGLKVLPVLNNLRRVAHNVADIVVQLDVFDEQRECDEALSLQGPNGINLNSHLDVFYAILRQVADTPQEIPFLSILQHLLRIDPKEPISDIIWDTTEKLVHRATLLENHEDSVRLLRAPSVQKFTCPHCRGEATSPSRKQSVIPPTTPGGTNTQSNTQSFSNFAPPPPPPPPPAAPPPPPPPMMMANSNSNRNNGIPGAPPAPPPPAPNSLLSNNSNENSMRSKTPEPSHIEAVKLLPQQETPAPRTKMKTINWNKIPPQKVVGKKNIWAIVADSHQDSPKADLDWNEMEGLFCLQSTNSQGSPKLGRDSGGCDTLDRKTKKENSEISLLDGKRSLNVNIFLKQFRSSNEDIIQLIRDGEHYDIGAEKLRGLLKILPEVDELDMLKTFDGDRSRLGNAEKFLLQLLEIPNYKLRIECMLLKEEFAANITYLEPCINAMLFAGEDLMINKMLQEVLYMVVVAGNFLNSGGYAGNAAGVKLSSLLKLTDIRANKPGMNLIHFVALQAEKRNPELLTFPSQLSALENASRTTSEQINNEINALDSRIRKIKKQIELPTTEPDIKNQMTEFLQAAEREVAILQRGMKEVETIRIKLAEFFCEDPGTFKIEECFKIFQNFCEKFMQAVKENERRRLQEEQATLRRKQREEQMARRAKQFSQCGTPVSDPENSLLLDPSMLDIRNSPAMSRRRVGSFNSSAEGLKEDGISPDITPNGSLRRRRSRALADEDDNGLMEFLRTSGHDSGNRERKASSYGSLDRSWARRARTGSGSKKRPDLLSIDFGVDRERPSSPSPLPEAKISTATVSGAVTEEPKPRISREWRQKIESWLQANENDEKYNEEYKRRRRLANNRRSLENESESDRNKLDPLPEEKSTTVNNNESSDTYKRVYPDWKPSATLEKTDVVGTIEAIEDAHTRDKSTWRKSNLNVPNSTENVESDLRKIKRQKSNDSSNTVTIINNPLQCIIEEDKRRSVIQQLGERPASDRLQIYIRRSSESGENDKSSIGSVSPTKPRNEIYSKETYHTTDSKPLVNPTITINDRVVSKDKDNKTTEREISSKVEIDSDNIETPPVARRIISSPIGKRSHGVSVTTINSPSYQDSNRYADDLGLDQSGDLDSLGQFDRFSAARRTRRYKRPTDYSSGNEDTSLTSVETTSQDSNNQTKEIKNYEKPKLEKTSVDIFRVDNKEERLKRWQERLKNLNLSKDDHKKSSTSDRTVAKLEKVGRHISSINQEDVREAIRNLKSPTGTPERIWSPPREIIKEKSTIIKVSNHELNDEGFEETQSLVSDTPSHGKESTSSCNEPVETRTKRSKPVRMTSTDSAGTTTSSDAPKSKPQKSQIQNLLERNKKSLERSRSMRTPTPLSSPQMVLPRRTSSLRKSDSGSSTTPQNRRDVERSSSRNSLRSSRSSLNSAVSTSTVRKMPTKSHLTSSVESSPSKRPLATQNSTSKSVNRIPASRSSSSGSSIGPGVRKPPLKTSSLGSTSFKENQQSTTTSSSSTTTNKTAARNTILSSKSNTSNNTPSTQTVTAKTSSKLNISTSRLSGFMRPTASSATKRQATDGKSK